MHFATDKCKVRTWQKEVLELREMVLAMGLKEEMKWGVPCFTVDGKNVLSVAALKDAAVISFFKGALIENDPSKILAKPGESSASFRYVKIRSIEELVSHEDAIEALILQAIQIEKEGRKIESAPREEPIPEELLLKFEELPAFRQAFYSLTPGRQRAYLIHFNQPKQSATRLSRIEKCMDKIFQGIGLMDHYKKP